MSCNFCRLPERNEPTFDVLQKMIELNRLGVNVEIGTAEIKGSTEYHGGTPAFSIRLYSGGVEIVRRVPQYNRWFVETVIDEMLKDLQKGATL